MLTAKVPVEALDPAPEAGRRLDDRSGFEGHMKDGPTPGPYADVPRTFADQDEIEWIRLFDFAHKRPLAPNEPILVGARRRVAVERKGKSQRHAVDLDDQPPTVEGDRPAAALGIRETDERIER